MASIKVENLVTNTTDAHRAGMALETPLRTSPKVATCLSRPSLSNVSPAAPSAKLGFSEQVSWVIFYYCENLLQQSHRASVRSFRSPSPGASNSVRVYRVYQTCSSVAIVH